VLTKEYWRDGWYFYIFVLTKEYWRDGWYFYIFVLTKEYWRDGWYFYIFVLTPGLVGWLSSRFQDRSYPHLVNFWILSG
jgi:hypothetical protein